MSFGTRLLLFLILTLPLVTSSSPNTLHVSGFISYNRCFFHLCFDSLNYDVLTLFAGLNWFYLLGIVKTGTTSRFLMMTIEDYDDPSANTRHDPSVPTNAKADTTP